MQPRKSILWGSLYIQIKILINSPGEELLAVLELLREELVQLVGDLEQVRRRRLGDHHL